MSDAPQPRRDFDAMLPQYATIRDRILASDLSAMSDAIRAFGDAAGRMAQALASALPGEGHPGDRP